MIDRDREIDLIDTFVVSAKRARYIELVNSRRGRDKFLRELYHFHDFERAHVVPIASNSDTVVSIVDDLKKRGAGDDCYVMSVHDDLDGLTGQLRDIISRVHDYAEGTLVSCRRGYLAYYEGEAPKNHFILHRRDVTRDRK